MSRPWSLEEVRDMILRDQHSALTAFVDPGIRDDEAPLEIAAKVARINELLAELLPLTDEIAAACGVEDES